MANSLWGYTGDHDQLLVSQEQQTQPIPIKNGGGGAKAKKLGPSASFTRDEDAKQLAEIVKSLEEGGFIASLKVDDHFFGKLAKKTMEDGRFAQLIQVEQNIQNDIVQRLFV